MKTMYNEFMARLGHDIMNASDKWEALEFLGITMGDIVDSDEITDVETSMLLIYANFLVDSVKARTTWIEQDNF